MLIDHDSDHALGTRHLQGGVGSVDVTPRVSNPYDYINHVFRRP
jgi:hypothetical protein